MLTEMPLELRSRTTANNLARPSPLSSHPVQIVTDPFHWPLTTVEAQAQPRIVVAMTDFVSSVEAVTHQFLQVGTLPKSPVLSKLQRSQQQVPSHAFAYVMDKYDVHHHKLRPWVSTTTMFSNMSVLYTGCRALLSRSMQPDYQSVIKQEGYLIIVK
jgi:hypothetical protein